MANKGVKKERKIAEAYKKAGWNVVRSSGSQSPFDLICWKGDDMHIIQLKYGSEKYLKYGFKDEEQQFKKYEDKTMNVKFKFIKIGLYERFQIN